MRDGCKMRVLKATFMDEPVYIYPEDDPVCSTINLVGCSTNISGARKDDGHPPSVSSFRDIRKANDLVAKFSWPGESRVSEVTFIQKAEEMGKTNNLVKGHIPRMVGNINPPYIMCLTSVIREFLDLDTSGGRVLQVIVFGCLGETRYLGEEDMVIGWLDCFLCKGFCDLYVIWWG